MDLSLFAPVPKGMESLLAGELRGLGATRVRQARAGVALQGPLEAAYRICLWSRLASRLLLALTSGPAGDGEQLYATAAGVAWDELFGVDDTFAVDFTGVSPEIRDTRFGAVRVKDAIVDQFRARSGGRRPSVDARAPQVRVNAHLARGRVTLALDLSGDSLHRRGYRADRVQVEAPLKENLAAAVLLYAEWPATAAAGGSFLDPLCGSGTLPIEAALIAADVAPGLSRAEAGAERGRPAARPHAFGFAHWLGHDAALWATLVDEARERRAAGLARLRGAAPGQVIRGSDRDARALTVARACVERAGLSGVVALDRSDLAAAGAPAAHGLLATNTPYGERLGEQPEAEAVCRLLGERLRAGFGGWRAAALTGGPRLAAAVGVPVKRQTTVFNGPLACTLAMFEPAGDRAMGPSPVASGPSRPGAASLADAPPPAGAGPVSPGAAAAGRPTSAAGQPAVDGGAGPPPHAPGLLSGGAEQFANRLHKNRRNLSRMVRREELTCYRLYDADLPDYNMVVDVYGDRVHVQEYAAPAEIDPGKVRRRLEDALAVVAAELDVPPARIVLKQRRRQRGPAQYGRRAAAGDFFPIAEDGLTYLVNLEDYLDTGLFIDQRLTRRLVRGLAGGARFLNLFAYTGTMTVNALAAGAPASTTVDISATYLEWAQRNLAANGFSADLTSAEPSRRGAGRPAAPSRSQRAGYPAPAQPSRPAAHRLVQADCLRWIAEAEGDFDLIWLDPPTFSNSKRMGAATFDVQRDHADLIRMTVRRLLAPGGVLLFATNRRNFRLDRAELGGLHVKDLSRATLPPDCARAANRHYVFRVSHSA